MANIVCESNEYFVFCQYRANFCPRAVFVPLILSNDETQTRINQLVELGRFVTMVDDGKNSNKNCLVYQDISLVDIPGNEIDLMDQINYWYSLLEGYDDQPTNVIYLLVDNDLKNLSPRNLYLKLLEMKQVDKTDKLVCVKNCFIYSDKPIDYQPVCKLRFFISTDETTMNLLDPVKLKKIILSDHRISSVQLAMTNDKFMGYGYVGLSYQYEKELFHQYIKLDPLLANNNKSIEIFFDKG